MPLRQRKPIGTVALMAGMPFNHMPFTLAYAKMVAYNCRYLETPDTYIHYDNSTVSEHSLARNEIVRKAVGEWCLMLDMDHFPEPDLTERLLYLMEWGQANVVSGLYVRRNPPHLPVVNGPKGVDGSYGPIGDWEPRNRPFIAHACGAGCLMVRTAVFKHIMSQLRELPFTPRPPLSEDYSFCDRLNDLGIAILVDPRIEYPHLTTSALSLANYNPDLVQMQPDDKPKKDAAEPELQAA